MSKTTIITPEVMAPFNDAEEGRALTVDYKKAIGGTLDIMRFGARFWKIRENVTTSVRARTQGGSFKGGDGFKAWLDKHAPEINRSTAYRFLGITESIMEVYPSIVGAKVAKQFALCDLVTTPTDKLPEAVKSKQLDLFNYVSGTSGRSWLDRFKQRKVRDHRNDKKHVKKELTVEEQLAAEQAEASDLIASPLRLVARDWKKHWSHLSRAEMEEINSRLATWRDNLASALNPKAV